MKKLIIVLLICAMLLSIPCASAGTIDSSDDSYSFVKGLNGSIILKKMKADLYTIPNKDKNDIINTLGPNTPGDIVYKFKILASKNPRAMNFVLKWLEKNLNP
ncbi:MAG: hypothetical protein Q4P14_01325 [Methanobacteriaceae archaeon]|nr:hypothetical protein [Methanobacteriaceae archaeon]